MKQAKAAKLLRLKIGHKAKPEVYIRRIGHPSGGRPRYVAEVTMLRRSGREEKTVTEKFFARRVENLVRW